MANIHTIFPTSFYWENNILSKEDRNILFDKITKLSETQSSGGQYWRANVKNSHGYYGLREDNDFNKLEDIITMHVNIFAAELKSNHNYKCDYGWYNVYDDNSYQEYHIHSNSIFSAVYFLSAPEGSSPLVFHCGVDDMLPMKNIIEYNAYNNETHDYVPEDDTLVIFRSNLKHMVPKGNNTYPRITLSYNFS